MRRCIIQVLVSLELASRPVHVACSLSVATRSSTELELPLRGCALMLAVGAGFYLSGDRLSGSSNIIIYGDKAVVTNSGGGVANGGGAGEVKAAAGGNGAAGAGGATGKAGGKGGGKK